MKWISLSISLPHFPPAQADHFINVRVPFSRSLFGYICSFLFSVIISVTVSFYTGHRQKQTELSERD